jgi:phenylacetate-coenzyme A ligase PaaK-like adenylate-forming protein
VHKIHKPLIQYQQTIELLLQQPVYGLSQAEKEHLLVPVFNALHQHHQASCEPYRNIVSANEQCSAVDDIAELPYLTVRLFKHLELSSIPQNEVFKILQSSGTTGQSPAKIFLDKATSTRQSKALVKILQDSIGKQRLPMLIIDSSAVLKDKSLFSARGAGIQGLAFFGRDHTYALDENMQPNWPVIEEFAEKYANQPVLIFGFTFMLWLHFIQALIKLNKKLPFEQGILLHSGGWKKLEEHKVDNSAFKHTIAETIGVKQVYNFYGMAEQVGSVFVECKQGHLHTPMLADVIVRDPHTLTPCKVGEQGLLQVLSVLPSSYPGHSLLTEDLGELLGIDDCLCGRKGKHFKVIGRLPKTEVRGCSDTHSGTGQ